MIKNIKGMSLIGVIVASSILGIVSYSLVQIYINTIKLQKTIDSRIEISSLIQNLSLILNDKEACKSSIQGQNITQGNSIVINKPFTLPATPLVQAGNDLGKYRVEDIKIVDNAVHALDPNKKLITIEVSFEAIGPSVAIKPNRFMVFTDAPGNIVNSCYGEESDQYICEEINGGDYNAAATPKCSLQATKDYFSRGMRFNPKPAPSWPGINQDNIVWIGAAGVSEVTPLGTDFKQVAPDCPINSRPIACMNRQIWAGNTQLVTAYSIEYGANLNFVAPASFVNSGAFNAGHLVSYFDLSDTYGPNNYPRCKIRLMRPAPVVDYYPVVRCVATSVRYLP
ncbi:MAG: type II secretion system protein [Bdellovibrionales bacterium]|nr:type II secretion system protein [Bdellovibrionales bacterium]